MKKQIETDVAIVGSGITGASIARELSRYKVDTIVVEKAGHLAAGQTKASSGTIYGEGVLQLGSFITKSIMAPNAPLYNPDSLKIKLMKEGVAAWPQIINELEIEHQGEPVLVVAMDKKQVGDLERYLTLGRSIGGRYAHMRWADRRTILDLQPHITRDVIAGLYSEHDAVQSYPWSLANALTENAQQNGVHVLLNAEVTEISQKNGCQMVETKQGTIKTRFVVNAAGIFADAIADMGGARDWGLAHPRNTIVILDKRVSHYVRGTISTAAVPGAFTVLSCALGGNMYINAGHYKESRDKYDFGTRQDELSESLQLAKRIIPQISETDIIRTFVAMRSFNTRDPEEHIIEPASTNPRFINVVVRLPGLSPAPAIAKYAVNLLEKAGLELVTKPDFNPYRKAPPVFRDLPDDAKTRLIAGDPRYGRVICRCETVTEGEIVDAIKRGARTVAGVKYMTRAGMGRCQSGFCGPRIVNIMARELNVPVSQIGEFDDGSPVAPYQSKKLLLADAAGGR